MTTKYALEKAIKEHRLAANNVIGTTHSIEESKHLVALWGQADDNIKQKLSAVNKEYCTAVSEAAGLS